MSSNTAVPRLELLAATCLFLAAACSPATTPPEGPEGGVSTTTTTAPATATTGTTATATDQPTGATKPEPSVVGAWASPSCGERTYPRHIVFAPDATFQSEDLVSPCPPKVVCVWSGIVHRKGTYTVSGGNITLTLTGNPAPQGKPLPDTLGIDPATGAPFEPANGSPACTYTRLEKKP